MDFFFRENVWNFERRMRIPPRRSLTKSAAKNRLPVLILIYLWMEEIDSGGQTNKCVDWAGGLVGGILRPLESSPNPAEFFFFFLQVSCRNNCGPICMVQRCRNYSGIFFCCCRQRVQSDDRWRWKCQSKCVQSFDGNTPLQRVSKRAWWCVCVSVCRCVSRQANVVARVLLHTRVLNRLP